MSVHQYNSTYASYLRSQSHSALLLPSVLPASGIENSVTKTRTQLNDVLCAPPVQWFCLHCEVDDVDRWRYVNIYAEQTLFNHQGAQEVGLADNPNCVHVQNPGTQLMHPD